MQVIKQFFAAMTNPQKIFLDWAQIHRDTHMLASMLQQKGSWEHLVAVTRGGLIPAALLSQCLNIRYIDTVCLQSYGDDTTRGELTVLKPLLAPQASSILVVDDLIDSGQTYHLVKKMLPQATYAVLYVKEPAPADIPFYAAIMPRDAWVVFPWEQEA